MGFVGKYFVEKYKDHDIVGIDLKEGNDCRDFFKTSNKKFDLVIHLAAIVGGRAIIEGAPLTIATDLSIDSEMCQWALKTKPSRVIYFSSSAAYPVELQKRPYKLKETDIDLNNIKNPDMTYGWAKLTGEFCLQFLEAAGIKVSIFRPFSGYGTDQDLDYPFPSFIHRGKCKMTPFDIWGDGTQVRDFIHVRDIVDAVDTAITLDVKGPINLGLSKPTTFNDFARLISDIAGFTLEVNHIFTAPRGVDYRCCDHTKMISFYTPKISLEQGIEMALKGIR